MLKKMFYIGQIWSVDVIFFPKNQPTNANRVNAY